MLFNEVWVPCSPCTYLQSKLVMSQILYVDYSDISSRYYGHHLTLLSIEGNVHIRSRLSAC